MLSKSVKIMFGVARVPFLALVPACVLLGTATAHFQKAMILPSDLAASFLMWLLAHISVNSFNEYFDFKSGLDLHTTATPFSGGSKTLPNNPKEAGLGLLTALGSLSGVLILGVYFVVAKGLLFLPFLLFAVVLITTYTEYLTRSAFLCLIAPGLGFGPVMVMGTHYILSGSYSWLAFFVSLVPFFLVSDLLLLNQFPDVEADKKAGRKHLIISDGRGAGVKVYILFLILPFALLLAGNLSGLLPFRSLIGLLPAVLLIPLIRGVVRNNTSNTGLIPYMDMNVLVNILTPLLLALGLFIS